MQKPSIQIAGSKNIQHYMVSSVDVVQLHNVHPRKSDIFSLFHLNGLSEVVNVDNQPPMLISVPALNVV